MSIQPAADTPNATAAHLPPAGPAPLSLSRRIAALFVRPDRLFEDLRAHPVWIGPLLIAIGVGILVIVGLPDSVFVESMQGATTRRGELVEITSEPAVVAMWERIRLSLGVAATHPLKALMLAGVLMLAFRTIGGGQAEFRHYFALAAHVLLISAAGALVMLPFQIAAVDPGLSATPALALPDLAAYGFVGRMLSVIDVFTVWMLTVAAIGAGVINRRSAAVPLALLLGAYLLGIVAVAAVAG
jgi:hypothetical protein